MRHYTIQPTALGTIVTGRMDICDRCANHDDCTLCEFCDTVVCGDCEESRRLDGVYVCNDVTCRRWSRIKADIEELTGHPPDEDQCLCGSRELVCYRPEAGKYDCALEWPVLCDECGRGWWTIVEPVWCEEYCDEPAPVGGIRGIVCGGWQ